MNGATADPWLKTINNPHNTRTTNIGNNQNFFLNNKNFQNSFNIEIIIKTGFSWM